MAIKLEGNLAGIQTQLPTTTVGIWKARNEIGSIITIIHRIVSVVLVWIADHLIN